MFTDGLPERREASGEMLGYEALVELFPPAAEAPGPWLDTLFQRLQAVGEPHFEDDWTALLLQTTPRPTAAEESSALPP